MSISKSNNCLITLEGEVLSLNPAKFLTDPLKSEKGRLLLIDFHFINLLNHVEKYQKKDKQLAQAIKELSVFREELGRLRLAS